MAFNKDFYSKLPSMVCELLDNTLEKYSKEGGIALQTAWDEYREYVLKSTDIMKIRMPGYVFAKYIDEKNKTWKMPSNDSIKHFGIIGMHWGVRKAKQDIQPGVRVKRVNSLTNEQKDHIKTAGIAIAGIAAGATVVGATWYLKNIKAKKLLLQRKQASIAKGLATKAARRAAGAYQTFKNVDVVVSGADFVKTFLNASKVKILQ